jgi:hypothetical protein
MALTQIQRGFYPISITHIKQFIKNCEQWGYGNKDTCKYVAENVIANIEDNHMDLPIVDNLYGDLVSIVHDMNSGAKYSRINISYKN